MPVSRIDQGMATAAVAALPAVVDPELRTRYKQLRIMLHSAGLAATYAFIAAKSGNSEPLEIAYRDAALGLRKQLVAQGLLTGDAPTMGIREVMGQLGAMDPVPYARASAEAAEFASWLSRLADAVCNERGGHAS
jgi:CRISPR/Cas system CMR-associated protein Cmr5 small subunit